MRPGQTTLSIGFDESAMSLLTIEPLEGQDQYLNAAAVGDAIAASSPTGDQALRVTKADGAPTDSGMVTTAVAVRSVYLVRIIPGNDGRLRPRQGAGDPAQARGGR